METERPGLLCPGCGSALSAGSAPCGACGSEPLVHGRWALERLLGSGGQGRTFAARDRQTGEVVAVKELSVTRSRDWKMIDLFRRSAGVVAGLDHAGVRS